MHGAALPIIVRALVDFCCSVLAGLFGNSVFNTAARLIYSAKHPEYIIPLSNDLPNEWLRAENTGFLCVF